MTKRARKPNVDLLATLRSLADTDLIGTLLGSSGDAPPRSSLRPNLEIPRQLSPELAILEADIAKLRELVAQEEVKS